MIPPKFQIGEITTDWSSNGEDVKIIQTFEDDWYRIERLQQEPGEVRFASRTIWELTGLNHGRAPLSAGIPYRGPEIQNDPPKAEPNADKGPGPIFQNLFVAFPADKTVSLTNLFGPGADEWMIEDITLDFRNKVMRPITRYEKRYDTTARSHDQYGHEVVRFDSKFAETLPAGVTLFTDQRRARAELNVRRGAENFGAVGAFGDHYGVFLAVPLVAIEALERAVGTTSTAIRSHKLRDLIANLTKGGD